MFFSLRNRLFFIFTILLTVPFILISILIPNWFTSVIENQTESYTVDMMEQYSLYLDNVVVQAEDLGKQVLISNTTQQWLNTEKEETDQAILHFSRNEMKGLLSTITLNNSNQMDISVFLNDGIGIWNDHPYLYEMNWYKEYQNSNQRWTKAHIDEYQQHHIQQHVNSFILPLYEFNILKLSGLIKVNIPSAILETALGKVKIGDEGRIHVLTGNGENVLPGLITTQENIVTDSLRQINENEQENGLIEISFEDEDYLVFYQRLSVGDWILFGEITKSELFAEVNRIQDRLIYTAAILFILTILASYVFSSNIVRPLGKMSKAMVFLEEGDFDGAKKTMSVNNSRKDEVGYVMKIFNQTINRLDNLIKNDYETNIRRKDAEYKALLLQINPHFLNNTLEIIGGLAAQGKNDEVVNVSVYLGRMMSYSLNTQDNIVTLGQEMEYIRNFTEILKLRYKDSIDIELNEDPNAKSIPINKFIIQPLVENAAKYSFIEKTHATISIHTKIRHKKLIITIKDDGVGMPNEVQEEILKLEHDITKNVLTSRGTSIGLKNVLGRLRLYYGEDFSFSIDATEKKGTKITLCIKIEGDIHDERVDL